MLTNGTRTTYAANLRTRLVDESLIPPNGFLVFPLTGNTQPIYVGGPNVSALDQVGAPLKVQTLVGEPRQDSYRFPAGTDVYDVWIDSTVAAEGVSWNAL